MPQKPDGSALPDGAGSSVHADAQAPRAKAVGGPVVPTAHVPRAPESGIRLVDPRSVDVLREAREVSGVSQRRIAQCCGLYPSIVDDWFRGARRWPGALFLVPGLSTFQGRLLRGLVAANDDDAPPPSMLAPERHARRLGAIAAGDLARQVEEATRLDSPGGEAWTRDELVEHVRVLGRLRREVDEAEREAQRRIAVCDVAKGKR